jgi:hypothetical protein
MTLRTGSRATRLTPFSGDDDEVDYDARNSVNGCELCDGSGTYDPLPKLLELTDDEAAERWVADRAPSQFRSL